MKCLIRTTTKPFFFVQAVRGVCFVTYVPEKDIAEALEFPQSNAKDWIGLLNDPDKGLELEMVDLKGGVFAGETTAYKLRQENREVFKKYFELEDADAHALVGLCPVCHHVKYICHYEVSSSDREDIEEAWVDHNLTAKILDGVTEWCGCNEQEN